MVTVEPEHLLGIIGELEVTKRFLAERVAQLEAELQSIRPAQKEEDTSDQG